MRPTFHCAPGTRESLYLPEQFLSNRPLRIPAKSGIEAIAFTSITLSSPVGPEPITVIVEPGRSLRDHLASHLGDDFSLRYLPASVIHSVGIEVTTDETRPRGKPRTCSATVGRTGLSLASLLDRDRRGLEWMLDESGIRIAPGSAPLLRQAV